MIRDDGWLDWAIQAPGPLDKVYAAQNSGIGYVPHSAVGYYGGWAARLFSTDRRPDGRYTAYAAASVHGWIAYDGAVTQHYPLTASCWASGSEYPNSNFIAFENEGGFNPENEPLTPAQIQANARIIRELAAWRRWNGFRRPADGQDVTANLYEHRECVRWGSEPTACPSGRIPWDQIQAQLEGAPAPPPPIVTRTITLQLTTGASVVMDVDDYVKGVVPYEMATGWPREALKAQAVAAKSYALAAGVVYADTRSQAYGDLRYADTNDAVDAVRGVYLGYQGQVVMAFYSAHCNGRTRSPSEAGWSAAADRPFLLGMPCICGNTTYYGHGIGMCQRGAQAMAIQGASFDQILRHYYQGIELMGFEGGPVQPPPPPASVQTYVIAPGDTLLAIAARFGVGWPAIYLANRQLITDPNILQPGWQIVIPRGPVEEGQPQIYVVQPGDTLFGLARAWGTTVAAIVVANGLADENLIRVGQRLLKP